MIARRSWKTRLFGFDALEWLMLVTTILLISVVALVI